MAETQIKITADTRSAERDIKNLERALGDLQSSAGDVAKILGVFTGAAAAMGYAITKTINAAGDLMDAANAIGVSAASLETLQTAAGLAGVGADALNNSLIKLNKSIGEGIAKGSGPAVDALKKLNVPIQEIGRMRPDEQFKRLSSEINAIESPAERTALAMELFGKQGPRILAVAGELEKVKKITDDIGFGISDRELQALDEASDSVDQLRIIWDAGIRRVVAEIAPYIVAIINRIKESIKEAGGFEGIWQSIKATLHTVANVLAIIGALLTARLVVGALAFTVQLGRALVAARGISTVLARTPIGLLAAGFAIIADKVGIDLVGGLGDALDLNLDIEAAQQQINDALDDKNKSLELSNDLAQGFTEEQEKALVALGETLTKLGEQVQYQRDVISLGEEEAKVNQTIAQERAKLAKVGLELTNGQEQIIRQLYKEETLVKAITKARDDQKAAIDGIFNRLAPVANKLADLQLKVAQAEYVARQSMGTQLEAQAQEQLDRAVWIYKEEVAEAAIQKSELLKINAEFQRQRAELENIQSQVIMAGFGTESEMYKALMEEKLRLTQEYGQRIEQVELARIQRQLQAEKGAVAQALSTKDQELLQRVGAEERQKAIAADRIAFEKKSDLEKTSFALDNMQTVFSALGQQNKKAFEASKALAIASALVNTYQGATKALATYPFPFGLIAAAAAVAAGMAQVAAIRSQQYSGRALGGPVMGGQSYIVGESGPELFTPSTTGSITRNSDLGGGGTTNVNFTIVANDTTGFDELLQSRQGVIKQVISDAMLERGQRSML